MGCVSVCLACRAGVERVALCQSLNQWLRHFFEGERVRNRSKVPRLGRLLVAVVATIAVAVSPLAVAPSPAMAAPVTGFQPGNIIDDALFYNGSSMNASEIQSFLNQRLSSCRIGTPGYMPGDPSPSGSGNIIASNCLKDFRQTTSSQPADQYCAAYVGAANETSAQIIEKVGRACGISQKVLLVMLEKEQSLLTDSWPVTRQYNYALGMNCPDSGPGGSANCDAASAGFSKQLYLGARQLKVYKGNPNSFNYKPFQDNTIQWHPNTGCGTSRVYIENWATAALYIYTPYRPNQAALDAGWGTGDGCSSYGNRNFFLFYTNWFGSTHGQSYPVTGKIEAYWNVNKSWLGMPTAAARTISSSGGGRLQDFTGGFVYESTGGDAVGITRTSLILKSFAAAGGLEGPWGWPTAAAVNQGVSGDNTMRFQGGVVVEANGVGVQLVPNGFVAFWQSTGGFKGSLGVPTTSAYSSNGALAQKFQKGAVVQAGGSQPALFDLRFVDSWMAIPDGINVLGLPVGSPVEVAAGGGGQSYSFGNGKMYRSGAGVFAIKRGEIQDAYEQAGGPAGSWGWPNGKLICVPNGEQCSATFVNGVAVWTMRRGSLFTGYTAPSETEVSPGSGESVTGGSVQ